MRNWWKLVGVAIAALIVSQLAVQRSRRVIAIGGPAPAVELRDLAGRNVSLASLRGRVVAVNFWASWCGPCQLEIPDLAEVWRSNRDRCFEVLGIAEESGGRREVADAARGFGIPYPVLHDPEGSAAEAFRVVGYPRTVLIDAEGRVRQVFDGMVRRSALEDAVKPLLPPPGACPRA